VTSDKSKLVAGLLQLVPGFCITLGGLGRLYAGRTMLGLVQLGASVVSWTSAACGFALGLPWAVTAAIWLWFVIDGLVILFGRTTDGEGHVLR
jgi:TM2 domain-containing membrane protein YozV